MKRRILDEHNLLKRIPRGPPTPPRNEEPDDPESDTSSSGSEAPLVLVDQFSDEQRQNPSDEDVGDDAHGEEESEKSGNEEEKSSSEESDNGQENMPNGENVDEEAQPRIEDEEEESSEEESDNGQENLPNGGNVDEESQPGLEDEEEESSEEESDNGQENLPNGGNVDEESQPGLGDEEEKSSSEESDNGQENLPNGGNIDEESQPGFEFEDVTSDGSSKTDMEIIVNERLEEFLKPDDIPEEIRDFDTGLLDSDDEAKVSSTNGQQSTNKPENVQQNEQIGEERAGQSIETDERINNGQTELPESTTSPPTRIPNADDSGSSDCSSTDSQRIIKYINEYIPTAPPLENFSDSSSEEQSDKIVVENESVEHSASEEDTGNNDEEEKQNDDDVAEQDYPSPHSPTEPPPEDDSGDSDRSAGEKSCNENENEPTYKRQPSPQPPPGDDPPYSESEDSSDHETVQKEKDNDGNEQQAADSDSTLEQNDYEYDPNRPLPGSFFLDSDDESDPGTTDDEEEDDRERAHADQDLPVTPFPANVSDSRLDDGHTLAKNMPDLHQKESIPTARPPPIIIITESSSEDGRSLAKDMPDMHQKESSGGQGKRKVFVKRQTLPPQAKEKWVFSTSDSDSDELMDIEDKQEPDNDPSVQPGSGGIETAKSPTFSAPLFKLNPVGKIKARQMKAGKKGEKTERFDEKFPSQSGFQFKFPSTSELGYSDQLGLPDDVGKAFSNMVEKCKAANATANCKDEYLLAMTRNIERNHELYLQLKDEQGGDKDPIENKPRPTKRAIMNSATDHPKVPSDQIQEQDKNVANPPVEFTIDAFLKALKKRYTDEEGNYSKQLAIQKISSEATRGSLPVKTVRPVLTLECRPSNLFRVAPLPSDPNGRSPWPTMSPFVGAGVVDARNNYGFVPPVPKPRASLAARKLAAGIAAGGTTSGPSIPRGISAPKFCYCYFYRMLDFVENMNDVVKPTLGDEKEPLKIFRLSPNVVNNDFFCISMMERNRARSFQQDGNIGLRNLLIRPLDDDGIQHVCLPGRHFMEFCEKYKGRVNSIERLKELVMEEKKRLVSLNLCM